MKLEELKIMYLTGDRLDCNGKLSHLIMANRVERPSEYLMDEFCMKALELENELEELRLEKANLYNRCLENEEAMYDAVINGNDNHLIELVEQGVNKI